MIGSNLNRSAVKCQTIHSTNVAIHRGAQKSISSGRIIIELKAEISSNSSFTALVNISIEKEII
jgi:hypothetical protein